MPCFLVHHPFFFPAPKHYKTIEKKKNPSDVNTTFSLQNSNAKCNSPTEKFGSANYLQFSFESLNFDLKTNDFFVTKS